MSDQTPRPLSKFKFKTLASQFYFLSLIPLAIQLIILLVVAFLLIQMESLANFDEHSQVVIGQCNYLESRLSAAALTTIAYIESREPNYIVHFRDFRRSALGILGDLYAECLGNAEQEEALAKLQKTTLELLRHLSENYTFDASSVATLVDKKRLVENVQKAVINKLWTEFAIERRQLLVIERERLTAIFQVDRTIVKAVCGAGIVLDLLFALNLVRSVGSSVRLRLDVLRENSRRLADEEQLMEPLSGDDEISSLDRASHAMSERLRKALDKERLILRSTVDIICTITEDGTFVTINPACQAILDYTMEDLSQRNVKEIAHIDDLSRLTTELEQAVSSQADRNFEICLLSSQDKAVHTSWSVRFVPSESVLFCTIRDISAGKEIEQMKQEFVRMISHDIRSPLTTVYGVFEILEHEAFLGLSEKGLPLLKKGQRSCERVLALTKDLLDIERLDAGAVVLHLEMTKMSYVLMAAAENVSASAEKARVTISVAPTQCETLMDASRITQVVTNLLTNAIKFSPAEASVNVSVREDPEFVAILVSDNGSGIPESSLTAIFERFKQVQVSDSTVKGGTGLGLAICRALVELHGGSINCRSQVGQGSTFEVLLPISKQHQILT